MLRGPQRGRKPAKRALSRHVTCYANQNEKFPSHGQTGRNRITSCLPTIRPECELGLGCMYSSPSARSSALHTFQAFGNSEKPTQQRLAGRARGRVTSTVRAARPCKGGEGLNVV